MTKKINKPTTTSDAGEEKQKIKIDQVKQLLSNKNTAPQLQIIQWPIWCMLWIALFDQSPEAQSIWWLWFTLWLEIKDVKIALQYCVELYKSSVNIEDEYIIVSGKIIKVPEDKLSEIEKEKFTFLPEWTEVQVKYDQNAWRGKLEILSYPLDLHQNISDTIDASLENFTWKTNVVSTLVWELNEYYIQLQKVTIDKNADSVSRSIEINKIKTDLIQSINLLRSSKDESFKEETYLAIQESPEYKKIKDFKTQRKLEKKQEIKYSEEEFDSMQKSNIEKLTKYVLLQNTHIDTIQKILEDETIWEEVKLDSLKLSLSKVCSDWIFTIADNFIAQDNTSYVFRKVPYEQEPEYVKWKLNIEEVHKTINLLTAIQEKYPDLLKQVWIAQQIKNSIHDRKVQVEKNVSNKIYNPFTRAEAIRYEHLWNMLAMVCWDDVSVLNDMIWIFDLLVQQRHPDWTNSGSFTGTVEYNISEYIKTSKLLENKDIPLTKNLVEYLDKEYLDKIWFNDIDSDFWMDMLINGMQNTDTEKSSFEFLEEFQSQISKSSLFPDAKISHYLEFVKIFFNTQKYVLRKWWIIQKEKIIAQLQDAYKNNLSYNETIKQRKLQIITKADKRAKELFKELSTEQRREYFTKVYTQTRWQTHNTGIYKYQEFDDASIITIISEHSYYGSRWGIERDSKLCLYVNECAQTSSTWNQNYRDRYDSKNDNYNNQYVDVLEVKKENDTYVITVKTWTDATRTLTMSPKNNYTINTPILLELSWIAQEDKKLFEEAIKFQKELSN